MEDEEECVSKKGNDSNVLNPTAMKPACDPKASVAEITTRENRRNGSPGTCCPSGIWTRYDMTTADAVTATRHRSGQCCAAWICRSIFSPPILATATLLEAGQRRPYTGLSERSILTASWPTGFLLACLVNARDCRNGQAKTAPGQQRAPGSHDGCAVKERGPCPPRVII